MAEFNIKPKNQLEINKKPRVYFTCHPEDFEKYFEKVCEDIFKTHDCAIYYTEDMTDVIAEDEKEVDLGRNNLFVVPVTYKLLSTPNRAMDEDIPYAFIHNIPVLPIMMESGIDILYSKPDKFGELQYLNPFSTDLTEISYEDKLKKHLESILICNEMAERVRAAFDAHIFLSYRKKDRKYANELMRLVHSNPACRDIAIWFDEFLTPGESFRENIDKILKDSKLFTLLVTPNLLEEPDGKPNFVMGEEFPTARDMGKSILPAEMVETDKKALSEKFKGLPECVNPEDEVFYNQLLDSIEKIATEVNNTPEHNYLIGLAYLDGIDVEVNREIALELITSAAEAGLSVATQKLYTMYNYGVGVELDYRKAVVWAEKYAGYLVAEYGEKDYKTQWFTNELAILYINAGKYQEALEKLEKYYSVCCELYGEENKNSLATLNNLAIVFINLKNYQKALQCNEKAYNIHCKMFGEEHPDSVKMLNNIACIHCELHNNEESLSIGEKAYKLHCKVFGEEHPETLTSLNNLASALYSVCKYREAMESIERVYVGRCKVLGEKHPHTILSLSNLGNACSKSGLSQKAVELNKRAYMLHCEVLGDEHPTTLTVLKNLAESIIDAGDDSEAIERFEKTYELRAKVLGENHSDTVESLNQLVYVYDKVGNSSKLLECCERLYKINSEMLGVKHPTTLSVLNKLTSTYCDLGDYKKAAENYESLYVICCEVFGEEDPKTMTTLYNLSSTYIDAGNYQKAAETHEKLYILNCKVFGENHPNTIKTLKEIIAIYMKAGNTIKTISTISILASIYSKLEEYQKAFPYFKKALELCKENLDEDHPYTISSWYNISYCYKKLGELATALLISQQIQDRCIRILGEEHFLTIKNRAQIEEIKQLLNAENQ